MGINNKIESNALAVFITSVVMFVVMGLLAIVGFFVNLKNEDQVLVPNVEGSLLEDALIELQAKELYPRLRLRFSDDPNERGRVLSQNPSPGAIVKAGRRVAIVVSRGTVIDKVDNYVGKNIKDVERLFASIFTSNSKKILIIKEPYSTIVDEAPEGTILEQNPPAGTEISSSTEIEFIVSRGNEPDLVEVPSFIDMDLNAVYATMTSSDLTFSFVKGLKSDIDVPRVSKQSLMQGSSVATNSIVELTIDIPISTENVFAIYETDLPKYPYQVDVSCDVVGPDNVGYSLFVIKHYGGDFQFPYYLPEGSIITITAQNEVVKTFDVSSKPTN